LRVKLKPMNSIFVTVDPDVMSGAPVFKGTRVLLQTLIDHVEAGVTVDDFLEGFPSVTREHIHAFLNESVHHAKQLVAHEAA
jgi:uncharacterized protein (DUF433 family)